MPLPPHGERFLPGRDGTELAYEHYARYLFAATAAGGRRVLDLGSGEGYGASLLAESAADVLAVDPAGDAVRDAESRYRRGNLRFQTGTAAAVRGSGAGPFDLVTCFEVVEHVGPAEQHAILADVAALLSPSGVLLVSTPNRPVYRESGGPGYVNPFHVAEMDCAEFDALLRAHFAALAWWAQTPLSGNLVSVVRAPAAAVDGWRVQLAELTDRGPAPGRGPAPEQAKYLIVACARDATALAALAAPAGLVLVDAQARLERERAAMARWAMTLEPELRAREKAARELPAATAALAQAEREAEAVRAEMGRLRGSRLWRAATAYWAARWAVRNPGKVVGLVAPRAARWLRRLRPTGRAIAGGGPGSAVGSAGAPARRPPPGVAELATVAERCRAAGRPDPSFLDWSSGLELGAALRDEVVFSPPVPAAVELPYADRSADVVVLRPGDARREAEARRVAAAAVVRVAGARVEVEWSPGVRPVPPPGTSVVVPVRDHADLTDRCLAAIGASLPASWDGEVVVVDDGSTDSTPALLRHRGAEVPWLRVVTNSETVGFVDACNRGAAAATGDLLVFLNNDAVPRPGWLEALTRTFREHPDAGAVGGKLLFPDGRLQEAGGAVFSDGSAFNVGRHEPDAGTPLYSFLREVDYCSGALLATPAALFRRLGGFDTRFRPAYYEDTDYCFRVRAGGFKVLYQPDAVAIHLEGATAGRELSAGVKQHQTINRDTFRARWRDELAGRPGPPGDAGYAAMHALVGPRAARRALVVSHTLPEFDLEGGSRRVFHLVRFLREAGWMVSFMAARVPHGERYERVLRQMGVATYRWGDRRLGGGPWSTEAERLIATGGLDLALIAFWHVAERWAPEVRRLSPGTRIVVDSVDLHFLRHARRAFLSPDGGRPGLDERFANEMRRELNQYHAADAVLTVSAKEADTVNDLLGRTAAFPVPDCEDLPAGDVPFAARRGVVFLGNMRHPPNLEAVRWLCDRVWPRLDPGLVAQHPLTVVGCGVDERLRALAGDRPGIKVVGWVPSVTPYLQGARVSVVPLLHGAGTKRKLIQAALAGAPSVATPIGAEGLGLTDGRNVLVASDPADFAAAMGRLLTDEALWTRLAAAGRAELARRHSPEASGRRFLAVIDDVLRGAA